ncbi:SURF1 family cytochrome oxidase biogenesis protein [Microbacterium sp. YY-01]|uniref:SURF1 family cytochrome oxidase biogenesis protein n=1 Tax=Microbacterium sp. YY-01 TaxID=3421634 RepID=UPI003D184EC3
MKNTALRWTGYIVIAVVFAILCAFLANWQFTRNEERASQIALVEQNYDAVPVPQSELISVDTPLDADDEWRPVLLHGEYDADAEVFVRNRPHGGTSAFEVLTPFRSDDGTTFIVNRGWVAPTEDSQPQPPPAPPSGEVEVVVRLRQSEPLPPSGRSAPQGQVPTIHVATVAQQVGGDVVTSAYGELVSETPAAAERPQALASPTEDPGPHLSYAIQWILFAIMGFAFISYVIRTEVHNRREGKEHNAVRERRRRDADASAEDELLDAAEGG